MSIKHAIIVKCGFSSYFILKGLYHLQTHCFQIILFFRKEPPPNIFLGFAFNIIGGLSTAKVESLYTFFNRTTVETQLMQGLMSHV